MKIKDNDHEKIVKMMEIKYNTHEKVVEKIDVSELLDMNIDYEKAILYPFGNRFKPHRQSNRGYHKTDKTTMSKASK